MRRPNPVILAAGLLLFIAVYAGVTLMKGGLYLDTHEGDTYHFLDILLRIKAGLIPHLDFPTPLGVMAFWPVSVFLDAGQSLGRSIILGQITVAGFLLIPTLYVGVTRFSTVPAWLFGLLTLGLATSLSFGSEAGGAAISMHYNRWAWSLAFVALALALLPAQGRDRPWLDGMMIGVLGALLALLKATYFAALGPGVLLAVALRWRGAGVLATLLGGALVALPVTLAFGPAFWGAYLGNLITVLGTDVRPFVGVPLNTIIAGPTYLGVTLLAVAIAMMLRQTDARDTGLALLLLVPGFIYVTYQNFGNDPQWIWLLGLLAWQMRPEAQRFAIKGWDLRLMLGGAAWLALALNFPSLVINAGSTINHAAYDAAPYIPMLPEDRGGDIYIRKDRAYMMTAQRELDREMEVWSAYAPLVDRAPLKTIGGVTIPECAWMAGSLAYFERFTQELDQIGLPENSQLFVADILSAFWLFGPYQVLEGGAPWYYGGLSGLANADFVLIPKCSFVARVRGIMIDDLNASGAAFTLVQDNDLFALFSVDYETDR